MHLKHLFSFSVLFSLAFSSITIPAVTGQGNPFQYINTIFLLRANSSPMANCIKNTNSMNSPLQCNLSFSNVTTFMLTSLNVVNGQYGV